MRTRISLFLLVLLSPFGIALAQVSEVLDFEDLTPLQGGLERAQALKVPAGPSRGVVETILPSVIVANTRSAERVHGCIGAHVPATTNIGGQPGFAMEFVSTVQTLSSTRRRWVFVWRPLGGFDGSRTLIDPSTLVSGQPPTQLQFRFGEGFSAGCPGDFSLPIRALYEVVGTPQADIFDLGGDTALSGEFTINMPSPTSASAALAVTNPNLGAIGGARMTFTLDTNFAPEISITAPADSTVVEAGTPITFSATANDLEDGNLSAGIVWTSDRDGALGSGASITRTLSAGIHQVTASVSDGGGRTATDSVTLTLATNTPPTVAFITPPDGFTVVVSESITIVAFAVDDQDGLLTDSIVMSSDLDGVLGVGGTHVVSLSLGTHIISASVTDTGGLTTTETRTITVVADQLPVLKYIVPEDGGTFLPSDEIEFWAFTIDPEDGDLSNQQTWTSSIDGVFATGEIFQMQISAGHHTITVSVTDSGGNTVSRSVAITVNTPPEISISSPADGSAFHVGDSIGLEATASDAEDGDLGSSIAWRSDLDGELGSDASLPVFLSPGSHEITASVTDSLGSTRDASITVIVELVVAGLDEDFEGDVSAWSTTGLWHPVANSACAPNGEDGFNSPTHAFYYGQDASCDYNTAFTTNSGTLTSPFIDGIEAGGFLAFHFLREVEGGGGGGGVSEQTRAAAGGELFDKTRVEVVSGAQVTTVFERSSDDESIGMWIPSPIIDLSSFAGQIIQIRFVFDTVDGANNGFAGWFVDDVRVAANTPPAVTITAPADGLSFIEQTQIAFSGTASDPEDGDLTASLSWASSLDGAIGTGGGFSQVLSVGGHTIAATVTDSLGGTASDAITVTVTANTPPVVSITAPADGSVFAAGTSTTLVATASDVEDGDLGSSITWSSDVDGALGSGASLVPTLTPGRHEITASVVDSLGGTDAETIVVTLMTPLTGLDEDFEGDVSAWSATGLWHSVSDSLCAPNGEDGFNSPTHAFYYGQDASCDYDTGAAHAGTLTSPFIDGIEAGGFLAFHFLREVEGGGGGPIQPTRAADGKGPYDLARVEVASGEQVTTVFERSSDDESIGMWIPSPIIDLSSFAGQIIQIRFVFDTVDEVDNGFAGWFIDDVRVAANTPPVVSITAPADGLAVIEQTQIAFSGTASDAEDGDLTASLSWESSLDGAIGTGGSFPQVLSVGVHTIIATATDSLGGTASDVITVTVAANTPPTVSITAPADGFLGVEGVAITFKGQASDAEDGDLTASLSWSSDLDGSIGTGGITTAALSVGTHTITAGTVDSLGAVGSIGITVVIEADTPPVVTILQPTDGSILYEDLASTFLASALDPADGDLAADLSWSSDVDGALGNGGELVVVLSIGAHVITAEVADSGGEVGSDTVTVTVREVLFADGFESGDLSLWSQVVMGEAQPKAGLLR